jgi:hypothetical protein
LPRPNRLRKDAENVEKAKRALKISAGIGARGKKLDERF